MKNPQPPTEKKFTLHCPNHTIQPEGYLNWHSWAEEMSKTHKQIKCPGCGKYAIWIKKRSN